MNDLELGNSIGLALKTWYPKDHKLHLNPHHPLGKLAGEWGELLDDYMKLLYKPGYKFDPINELGDIWYYVRVLAYQGGFGFRLIKQVTLPELDFILDFAKAELDLIMAVVGYWAKQAFILHLTKGAAINQLFINTQFTGVIEILGRQGVSLDDLTASNWEKLKPGSERGEQWMKARLRTEYVNRGKIG